MPLFLQFECDEKDCPSVYTMMRRPGQIVGGVAQIENPPIPPGWTVNAAGAVVRCPLHM